MQNIEIYEIGYCKHPEFMVLRGGSFKSVKFPAMVASIEHKKGNLLFDTGYSTHFFDTTKRFPEKFYALTTPVTLDKPLCERINKKIDYIFISHFHADHIGGLKDFPNAHIFCSKEAYELSQSKKLSRFSKTKQGVLPALLPEDFERRVTFIEDLKEIDLPPSLYPFTKGYTILDDIYIIELPGHAHGQYGMLVDNYFFISDAIWDIRAITENAKPNILTSLIMKDMKEYYFTIEKLKILHKNNSKIEIIPTHCTRTLNKYIKKSHDV
jgi:glyoxylase-like metal-dependent hydrolase (beta-lactamase superfamily II)